MDVTHPPRARCTRTDLYFWIAAITEAGYSASRDKSYVVAFSSNGHLIYLDKMTSKPGIIFHPNLEGILKGLVPVRKGKEPFSLFHNSGMDAFPKRLNNGMEPEHYGVKVQFSACSEIKTFLEELSKRAPDESKRRPEL